MKLKIASIFVTCIVLCNCLFLFNASALRLDGVMDEPAWRDAQSFVLSVKTAQSNCGVKYGVVSVLEDAKSSRLNFGFKVTLDESVAESTYYGVAVKINSSDFIYVTANGAEPYDTDKFAVYHSCSVYPEDTFTLELDVAVKYGLHTVQSIAVRFIDANGISSNVYELDYSVSAQTETTAESTTKVTTTKEKTTKEKTTQSATTKAEKTTQPKPVKNETSTTKVKTKPSTTKVKTTKPKTTVKKTTTVHLTAVMEQPAETVLLTESSTAFSAVGLTDTASSKSEQTQSMMKLKRKFSYTAVAVLITFALGICVAVNSSREKQKEKDK